MSQDLIVPDSQKAVSAINKIPVISSEAYGHLGKYAGAIVLSVFEQIGGIERFAAWSDSNPSDYYTKIFGKVVQRSTAVEHSGTLTIDDAITRLESQGQMIDAEFEDVTPQYDL